MVTVRVATAAGTFPAAFDRKPVGVPVRVFAVGPAPGTNPPAMALLGSAVVPASAGSTGDLAEFTGQVTIPAMADGPLRLTAMVGSGGDTVQRTLTLELVSSDHQRTVVFERRDVTVEPGGLAHVSAGLRGDWKDEHGQKERWTVRLRLRDLTAPVVSLDAETIDGPGNRHVDLAVAADAPAGPVHGVVEAVDVHRPEVVLASAPFDLRVEAKDDSKAKDVMRHGRVGAVAGIGILFLVAVIVLVRWFRQGMRSFYIWLRSDEETPARNIDRIRSEHGEILKFTIEWPGSADERAELKRTRRRRDADFVVYRRRNSVTIKRRGHPRMRKPLVGGEGVRVSVGRYHLQILVDGADAGTRSNIGALGG
jgi:hypothetical protein